MRTKAFAELIAILGEKDRTSTDRVAWKLDNFDPNEGSFIAIKPCDWETAKWQLDALASKVKDELIVRCGANGDEYRASPNFKSVWAKMSYKEFVEGITIGREVVKINLDNEGNDIIAYSDSVKSKNIRVSG